MVVSSVLYAILAVLSIVFLYLKSGKKYWQSRGVLTKPPHFFLGNLKDVARTVHFSERQIECYNDFKDRDKFFGFYMLNKPVAVITDLELVRDVCVKVFRKFHDRGVYVNEKADPLTPHLFSLDGAKWSSLRNKLSPTFTTGKIKMMCHSIVDIADNMQQILTNQVAKNKTIDAKLLSVRYSIDVVSSTMFGLDTKTLEDENAEILKIYIHMNKSSVLSNFKIFFINSYQTIAEKLGMKRFPDIVASYFIKILGDAIKNREHNIQTQRNDFVDTLIRIKNSAATDEPEINNNYYSEEQPYVDKVTYYELAATAFDFFFAGYETSSAAMSYCLLQLAINQDVQDQARAEVQNVLDKYDNKLTYEGAGEMQYLEQCFNEAMRLFPPAHTLIREATEDYKVPDTQHVLEKGTQIFIPVYSIHRDEKIYPDPLKFDPDRFSPENVLARHPYAFLPFGEGPRMCIAMRFAMLQNKIGLASILSNFKMTLNSKTKLPIQLEIDNPDMGVRGGIWLDFEKI